MKEIKITKDQAVRDLKSFASCDFIFSAVQFRFNGNQ